MRNTLKVQRAIKDITQQQLAELVHVSRLTINSIEQNKYSPSLELALRIARYFKKPIEELFWLEEDE